MLNRFDRYRTLLMSYFVLVPYIGYLLLRARASPERNT